MKTIKLFNNVIIVHGSSRDLLFDMLTEKYYFIPKSMTCYLNSNNVFENKNITKDIIFEYEKFIKENNLGYKLIRRNSSNYFLNKMSKTYDFPSIVTNFVLHFDYCKNISVRALSSFGVYALVIIVDKMINTSVIDLFISSSNKILFPNILTFSLNNSTSSIPASCLIVEIFLPLAGIMCSILTIFERKKGVFFETQYKNSLRKTIADF